MKSGPSPPLTTRALNRALLARQMLLGRESIPVKDAIERLVGLQAQLAGPPFVGLWSRVESFERSSLLDLIKSWQVVRATMMRATIHLMSADDYIKFRECLQPILTAAAQAVLGDRVSGFDVAKVISFAESHFKQCALTFDEVRKLLIAEFPDADERAMGYVVRTSIPLVMVPDDSESGYTGAQFRSARAWLGRDIVRKPDTEEMMLHYLAAFGPASAADAQAWSGLRGLKPLFERLRPKLLVVRDDFGRELFDVPNAPRPSEDATVPVRFIAGFDNLLLSHSDRTRIIADEHRPRVVTKNLQVHPTFLVDGFVAGIWSIAGARATASLKIAPFRSLPRPVRRDLEVEGERLARFLHPSASRVEIVYES